MSELFHETAGPGITVHSTDIPSITFPEASLSSDADSNPRQTANADATQEQLWKGLSSLYDLNVTLKADAAVLDGSSKKEEPDGKQSKTDVLNDLLDTFMNGADVVLNELTILGNAHPILAVAIFAFHEVIKLDLARRDNNKKVLVVVLQMQNMLGPMFQLRNLDHQHMLETERRFHENRLKELIEVITQDIKMCRSDLTHFMNRKFVYKLVLARGYERKFAGHIETFAQRRVELQTIISEYVAVGISNANKAIHSVGTKVDVVDDKLDRIITAIFRNVDTPREKDVLKFIEQNGGPIKCVENSDLLPKLISKVGESPKTGKVAISSQAELEELQKELIEALNEDLDKVLDKHFLRFEKVLQVQSNNMKLMSAHLEDQGVLMQTHTTKLGKILDTVTTIMVLEEGKVQTKAVKLKDPEIQRVWRQMNLTSSVVKAKVFVLTFRDHIRIDNSNLPTPTPGSIPLPGSSPEDSDSLQPSAPSTQADDWVLEYIDVAYVQPIVEAIDEDGSGFISVQEANTFALARPEGMSLLHWIAYWAAGWHHNLTKYQKEIYEVLLKMNDALPNVHVTNRVYVDDYLDKRVMSRVEALLRSVRALSDMSRRDRKLVGIAEIVASRQMKQLEANLQDMGCVVESRLDATTIAGGARVETWIFPLLLLLLRRHLEIIHLSKTVVLDREEFLAHTRSLENVFAVFDERLQNLEAKFRQLHSDVDAHFLSFSYGMFNVAYKKQEFNVFDNTLMTLKADEYPHSDSTPAAPDITILSKPVGKTLDLKEVDLTPSSPPEGHIPHPTEGEWFGWFQSWTAEKPSYMRPYHCVISPVIDKKLVGKGEGFFGTIDINGSVESSTYSGPYLSVRFDLLPSNPIYLPFTCQGAYNEERDTIEGTYDYYVKPESTPQTAPPANSVVDTNPGLDASNIGEAQASNVATDDQARQVVQPNTGPTERTPDTPSQAPEIVSGSLLIEAPEIGMGEKEVVLSSQSENGATDTIGITEDKETHIPPAEEKKEDTESQSPENGDNTALSIVTVPQNHAGNGRFFLKRTPAHLFRFRRYLDGPDMPPCWKVWPIARKRWGFAIAAIVSETRARMNSRKTFNEALAERRKWLSLSMRFDQTDIDITPARYEVYESLTDKEWDAYDYLLTSVPPKIALLYEELAHYMARREIYLIPVGRAGCDVCHWNLSFTRHQCIYCMEEDMRDYVDICHNCIDKPVPASNNIRTFSHSKSHSLMRSQHRIHIHEFNAVIPQARLISERSKKMFRDLEEQSKLKKERHSRRSAKAKPGAHMILYGDSDSGHQESNQPGLSPILCGCCNEAVTLPCWVCLICSPLTFFCIRCERANAEVTQSNRNHSRRSHRILRIHDSIEVKSVTGKQMNDVGLQLQDLNSTMTLIDSKLNKQVEDGKEIKGIVDDVARKVGAWNDGDGTASVGPWIDEQHLEGYTGDASKVLAQGPLVEGSSEAGKNMNNVLPSANPEADKSEIERRLSTLEVKVGDISTKMDGLEHKLDALFTLVQSFVESRTTPNGSA